MLSSRLSSLVAVFAVAGTFLTCSGCGSKASSAQSPPPQTLSEPVVAQSAPVTEEPRAIPVSNREIDARPASSQVVGESRELPQFVAPSTPPTPRAAVVVASPAPSGGGRYHTLAKGETLSSVSRTYNVKLRQVLDANHFKDPNHLSVGTKVLIP